MIFHFPIQIYTKQIVSISSHNKLRIWKLEGDIVSDLSAGAQLYAMSMPMTMNKSSIIYQFFSAKLAIFVLKVSSAWSQTGSRSRTRTHSTALRQHMHAWTRPADFDIWSFINISNANDKWSYWWFYSCDCSPCTADVRMLLWLLLMFHARATILQHRHLIDETIEAVKKKISIVVH